MDYDMSCACVLQIQTFFSATLCVEEKVLSACYDVLTYAI